MKRTLLIFSLLFILFGTKAGNPVKDTIIRVIAIEPQYSINIPGGDMLHRFGYCSTIGGKLSYKTTKNWLWNIQGNFLFGDQVKQTNLFPGIQTENGNVIDGNGNFSEIYLFERGMTFSFNGGKLFPIIGPNPNSGIVFTQGIGFLQHKIRIESPENLTPQIFGEYAKGYDHLSNGIAFNQFIGYKHLSNSNRANFYFGFEIIEAWTKNRRSFNFDSKGPDNRQYLDVLYGFRIGWTLTLQKRSPQDFYYN